MLVTPDVVLPLDIKEQVFTTEDLSAMRVTGKDGKSYPATRKSREREPAGHAPIVPAFAWTSAVALVLALLFWLGVGFLVVGVFGECATR